jgi:hypothetical protein
MSRIDEYREALVSAAYREAYMLAHSGLPAHVEPRSAFAALHGPAPRRRILGTE